MTLIALRIVGVVNDATMGGFIHLLLVIVIIIVSSGAVAGFISGRRV